MITFQKPKYQLNIMVVSPNQDVKEYYNKFTNHHNGDSGVDLFYALPFTVNPTKIVTLDFEIQCEMIDLETNTYTSYYLLPRSSIANTNGLMLANTIGVIDAGYRGNLKAKVINNNNDTISVDKGISLFQVVAPDLKPIKISVVEYLSETTRNDGGFGSTNH